LNIVGNGTDCSVCQSAIIVVIVR